MSTLASSRCSGASGPARRCSTQDRSSRPTRRFAEVYAREQYGRRGESTALWLVPREAVDEIEDFVDEFDLKYRRVDGYSIKERLKEARERAGAAAPRAG